MYINIDPKQYFILDFLLPFTKSMQNLYHYRFKAIFNIRFSIGFSKNITINLHHKISITKITIEFLCQINLHFGFQRRLSI